MFTENTIHDLASRTKAVAENLVEQGVAYYDCDGSLHLCPLADSLISNSSLGWRANYHQAHIQVIITGGHQQFFDTDSNPTFNNR